MEGALFHLLDACVGADEGPAGFEGKVAVGIVDVTHVDWWVASFGASKSTERTDRRPDDCDAMLMLSREEATQLMEGVGLGPYPRLCTIVGDRACFLRFSRRYLDRKSMLGIRVATQRAD